ncbi:MAG: glycosyltransferase [Sphingobium sp.]|nr:glycosyltransferase [Sphingobium sp.]
MGFEDRAGRPLRILGVLHSLEPGGVERDLMRFTKAWRDRGVDARIALGRWEGLLTEEAPDIPFIIPPKGRLARIETETLWMMQQLPAIVRAERPDVVFIPSNGLMAVAAWLRLVLGRACPPIVVRPSNSLDRKDQGWFMRSLDRTVLRAHSGIYAAAVAMSAPMRAEIIERMGLPGDRVVTINNASMTKAIADGLGSARDAAERDRAGRHFLGLGRLMPQKNFGLLLDAFARIARPQDRLTIVGEGALRGDLEAQAVRLGIADRLDMPGHKAPVDPWFANADAFVLSSDFEGLPAVVSEALAAGIPTVATDCTVALPAMIEGVGTLVPVKDVDALASAMDRICDDPVDVQAMRARSAQFTMEATVEQWIALFERVARK